MWPLLLLSSHIPLKVAGMISALFFLWFSSASCICVTGLRNCKVDEYIPESHSQSITAGDQRPYLPRTAPGNLTTSHQGPTLWVPHCHSGPQLLTQTMKANHTTAVMDTAQNFEAEEREGRERIVRCETHCIFSDLRNLWWSGPGRPHHSTSGRTLWTSSI